MPKRRQYDQQSMEDAVNDVKRHRLNISQAAREHNVPRKTIYDHVKNNISRQTSNNDRIINTTEEDALVNYTEYMAKRGFPISREMLKMYVREIIQLSGRKTTINMESGPSHKWIRSFISRHPLLSEKVPESQEKSRNRMSNTKVISQYFNLLKENLESLNLTNKPAQIFNCDETGFSTCSKEKNRSKVLVLKGAHSCQQQVLTTGHVTAHICISGDGRVLPTFLIFESSLPHRNFKDGVPDTWLYGTSDSGYMDTLLFEHWFERIFIPYCGSHRPVLLILDNHDSHISLNLIEMAKANDIHILGLPPHTTHILQPLDVGINGPLKEKFRSLAVSLGQVNSSMAIGKSKFPILLSTAIDQVCNPAKIKDSFRRTGIIPVNIDAIDKSQIVPSDFQSSSSTVQEEAIELLKQDACTNTMLCHCCGELLEDEADIRNFKQVNPLVKSGLIPETLAEILLPPASSSEKIKSKKNVTEARVITGDEMLQKLTMTKEAETKKIEEKQKRQMERAEKKEKNERMKETKRMEIEEKKIANENAKTTASEGEAG